MLEVLLCDRLRVSELSQIWQMNEVSSLYLRAYQSHGARKLRERLVPFGGSRPIDFCLGMARILKEWRPQLLRNQVILFFLVRRAQR